jgi:hypothetical protein
VDIWVCVVYRWMIADLGPYVLPNANLDLTFVSYKIVQRGTLQSFLACVHNRRLWERLII